MEMVISRSLERLGIDDAGSGVAIVTFKSKDGAPFVLDPDVLGELETALSDLAGKGLRGLLFQSAHPSVFCAGADIDAMAGITSPAEAEKLILRGQQVFERIAHLPFPTVALIHGTCVGGGFELALACGARTATPDSATRIGLPEIKLGILPAWGGSTRLPRLIGLVPAVGLITAGRTMNGLSALRAGLVDSVVPKEHLQREGLELLEKLRKGASFRKKRGGIGPWILEGTPFGRRLVEKKAQAAIQKETRGHYPAPIAALRVLTQGIAIPHEASLALERVEVLSLLATPTHKNLLRVFQLTRESRRPAIYATGKKASVPNEVAVLGAGVMGSGIAALLARSGLSVRVIDPVPAALARSRKLIQEELGKLVSRKELSRAEAATRLARASFSTEVKGLRAAQLVIEAASEKRDLKLELLGKVAQEVSRETVIASNTSSFPITELAKAFPNPERFLGLHFFNPPLKMPLLEIIRGQATSDQAIATGLSVAAALGKTAIVVGDAPGFLVNRLLAPYLMEACKVAESGVPISVIDTTMAEYGLPMGPFRLMDEVGLDILLDASRQMAATPGAEFSISPMIETLVREKHLGKKSGSGFYAYGKDGRSSGLSKSAAALQGAAARKGAVPVDTGAMRERLLQSMLNEARRVLSAGLVLGPEDIDIGTIFGLGYPAFRGGLWNDLAKKQETPS